MKKGIISYCKQMKNKKRTARQALSIALALVLCFYSLGFTAMAAEANALDESVSAPAKVSIGSDIMPTSVYGYAAYYTDASSDTFTVNAPGTSASKGGATIKTTDFGSSTIAIYVTIVRPDGTTAKSDIKLTGNDEKTVSFSNSIPGTYKIYYQIFGTYQGWIHCWIF